MIRNHRKFLALATLAAAATVAPVWACGPFLYDNAELDQFSLIDPGILTTQEWTPFLAFSSPSFGHTGDPVNQEVIQAHRPSMTTPEGVDNLVYNYAAGEDPALVAANEAWWKDYFQTARNRAVSQTALEALLYEASRPSWLTAADRRYLDLLSLDPTDGRGLNTALAAVADTKLPPGLRHRFGFWAVRALTLQGDARAVSVFRDLSKDALDLPLARAQGWAASALAETDAAGALKWWLEVFLKFPELRAQTFASLDSLPRRAWAGNNAPEALLARFFLDGRDFSPETLSKLASSEKAAGRDGSWTEAAFYSMAEQIEAEAGVFALFRLVDPHETPPRGLFTKLVDGAVRLAEAGTQRATAAWWLIASYLCLFDGDTPRAGALLERALALPRTEAQAAQADLIGALVAMDAEKDRDWSPALQARVVKALVWGKTLNASGHNRGLYHSVAVLAAQKYLARGRNAEAALAYGLVQGGDWSNPYTLASDDGFWAVGWPGNNSVNLLLDALLSDDDLNSWRDLLHAPKLDPLTAMIASRSPLSDRDLTWWQAHRALRRGQSDIALRLFQALGGDGTDGSALFPKRPFSYSVDLDPFDPGSGQGMKTVSPVAFAAAMSKVDAAARDTPSSKTLLAQGVFWFSVQISGMPLLFSAPPTVISFVNGNFEYYGYDGKDADRASDPGEFPLGRSREDDWEARLSRFYAQEFSTLDRARQAFRAVLDRHDSRDAEYRALLFLQALDGDQADSLKAPRYDGLGIAERFRATCEWFL